MGNSYLILVGIAPDGCSYLNGKYHQEEPEELEDIGDSVRGSSKSARSTMGAENRQHVNEQAGRG